jgi:hypothetical protein
MLLHYRASPLRGFLASLEYGNAEKQKPTETVYMKKTGAGSP